MLYKRMQNHTKAKTSSASARQHISLNTKHKASVIKGVQKGQSKQTIALLKPAVSLSCTAILVHSFYLNKAAHKSHTHSLHHLTGDAPMSPLAAKRDPLCTFSAARVSTAAALERRSEVMALGQEVMLKTAERWSMPHLKQANLLTPFPLCISSWTLLLEHSKTLLWVRQASRQCLQASISCCPTLISSSSSTVRSMAFHMQTTSQQA